MTTAPSATFLVADSVCPLQYPGEYGKEPDERESRETMIDISRPMMARPNPQEGTHSMPIPSDDEPIRQRRKQIEQEDCYPWEQPCANPLRVLLINPPAVVAYGSFKSAAKAAASPQMPLGILYIGGVLREAGHQVEIIDCDIDGYDAFSIVDEILRRAPDVVGLTATTPIVASAIKIIEQVKQRSDIVTILGGYHITALPIQTMQRSVVDYGIYGEGEATVTELLDLLARTDKKPRVEELKNIRGLLFRDGDRIVANEKRPLIKDLDRIPYPARDLLRNEKYIWSVPGKGMVPVAAITTQRGCPFQCIFCGAQTMFPGMRYHSIPRIIAELRYITEELGIRHLHFQDDTLTLNRKKVTKMAEEIRKHGITFTWEGYTRANTIDRELLAKLKSIGLNRLSFGVETGNEGILKAIKKGVPKQAYVEAYRLCREEGIETRCSIIIGHPFETKETIKETIRFACSLDCYQAYINIATPYPGSELLELAREGYGGIKLLTEDWNEYRRYGNAVMEMNDLSVEDLVKLQKWAYRKFYLRSKIIWYNVTRAGLRAAVYNGIAFFKSVFG